MFWDNILDLCVKNNISPNAMCANIGLSNATATKWKNGSIPHAATLKKIANYFNVSTEYLLSGTNVLNGKIENPSTVTDERVLDEYIIHRLMSLTPDELAQVDAFVQGLLANRKE